jgi:hypothetical protein
LLLIVSPWRLSRRHSHGRSHFRSDGVRLANNISRQLASSGIARAVFVLANHEMKRPGIRAHSGDFANRKLPQLAREVSAVAIGSLPGGSRVATSLFGVNKTLDNMAAPGDCRTAFSAKESCLLKVKWYCRKADHRLKTARYAVFK